MILETILRHKKREVEPLTRPAVFARLKRRALASRVPSRPFAAALKRARPRLAFIAEIKRRSPSKGLLRASFRPAQIAKAYQRAGASALSVLTDRKFFGGSAAALRLARRSTRLPILRKDFIVHEAQVYESRLMGADAILLIAAALTSRQLADFSAAAARAGLDVLYEVHDRRELKKVLALRPALLGVNNRNLRTFRVDLGTTGRLVRSMGSDRPFIVAESGIRTAADAARLKRAGAGAVLVGEALMRESDVESALRRLRGAR